MRHNIEYMTSAPTTTNDLIKLYSDPETCARIVGLQYGGEQQGWGRRKAGTGFVYLDRKGGRITGTPNKKWIESLVIPPAWKEVWINPNKNGHILATGIDEKARKQYIYHPKWRVVRDLLKFYRMIVFAEQLPHIRRTVDKQLELKELTFDKVAATMLWLLDNTYIRIGNDVYLEENESVGLTTLADHNIVIAGTVVSFSFKAKSGKEQQFSIEDRKIAQIMAELQSSAGERFFQYQDESGEPQPIDAASLNTFLASITETHVTAKDFRTWGGTLLAFNHLVENNSKQQKPEKLVVEAVDSAAQVLGNTRAVAKSSYVHPHILSTYGSKNFDHYYLKAKKSRKMAGLDSRESELVTFLQLLFEEEFDLLAQK